MLLEKHMAAKKQLTKKHLSGELAPKPRFTGPGLLVFILVFAAIGGYILWRTLAAPPPPTMYLTPVSQSLGPNTSFSVQVRENSGTTPVNVAVAEINYPANLIDFVSIDTSGSDFNTNVPSSGGAGLVDLSRGACVLDASNHCTPLTGDKLIATLFFKTKAATGSAVMSFTTGTSLISSATNLDILGSLAATAGGTYNIDATGPTVSITSPSPGASLAGGTTVSLTASAADASAVSKVEFYVDGALAGAVTTGTGGVFTFPWNTSGLNLGSHTISAKAYDTFGNTSSSTAVAVTLADKTAPSVPVNFRASASTTTSVDLAWNASTDNVGVTAYVIKRGATTIATVLPPALTYTDAGLAAGTSYTYYIQALDAAGNVSAAATLNTATTAPISTDLNGDGHTNGIDLSILLSHWASSGPIGDINHDSKVDGLDLSILLSHYNT